SVERKAHGQKPGSARGFGRPGQPIKGAGVTGRGKAPAFRLPRDGGGTVRLADLAARKIVRYFYSRAHNSGCTREAVDFSRLKSEFSRAGTEILGISADPVAALDRFKSKHKLTVALASDEAHNVLDAYGVWQQKTLYGRKFIGIVRTTFLMAPMGVLPM